MSARLTSLLLTVALLAACKDDAPADDALSAFRAALPDEATLAVDVPGDDAEVTDLGLTVQQSALPLPATLRDWSHLARVFLTRTIGDLLDAFHDITKLRPVLKSEDRVVWWTPSKDGLFEALLVMERDPDDGHFTFTSWLRDRGVGQSAWRFLAFGTVTPGETSGDGRGALWIDLEHDRKPRTHGKVVVLWSEDRMARDLDVRAFDAATDGEAQQTRGYRYHEDRRGGVLAFDAGDVDVHVRPGDRDGMEHVRVITRWDEARRFRSDATSVGEEVVADGYRALVDTQCWQAPAATVLYDRRVGLARLDGHEETLLEEGDAQACPFARAAVPVLPTLGDMPTEPMAPPETDPARDWGD